MFILEIVRVAFAALRANKTRSLLTMLGIVIGIGAVISIVSLGNGAKNAVAERLARLGTTVLQVDAQRIRQNGVGTEFRVKMTANDAEMIKDRSPHVLDVNYTQDRTQQFQWHGDNAQVQITGTIPNFLFVRNFAIERGRMFSEEDNHSRRRVCVLGGDVMSLFGVDSVADLLGETVRIRTIPFTVIGVLKRKGATGFGNEDVQILIPFETSRFLIYGNNRVDDIWARATSEADLPLAMGEITIAMRRSHKIGMERPDDFRIRNQADFLETLGETTETFTLLLASVAAVSLLVGGIGIMNIMLVSVTERTKEIGVRKALGATNRSILLQFLTEALVLCAVGGALGVTAGLGSSWWMSQVADWNTAVGLNTVALAIGVATGTGLLFGVLPARRAAHLDPIEALRHE